MAGKQSRKNPKFTIEDAFEEDADDAIRLYGATNERSPFKPKDRDGIMGVDDVSVNMDDSVLGSKGFLTVPDVDAISRDSDSLIPGDSSSFSESPRWWFLHPKVREKWTLVAGAFTLLILGLTLLVTGVVVQVIPIEGVSGIVFIITGLICFIPGAYHIVYVIFAVSGRRGYDFYNLPLFN
ncbi:transmembrane protein 134-like [Penaeus chinensis]|uniref:transmembrane protein 134-like n=1 Tax=Penaeus chinensis TaxID=139456 RepID=UPI001FB6A426|nr:transmembrane protein 134-like [Penaeus chinensis]